MEGSENKTKQENHALYKENKRLFFMQIKIPHLKKVTKLKITNLV